MTERVPKPLVMTNRRVRTFPNFPYPVLQYFRTLLVPYLIDTDSQAKEMKTLDRDGDGKRTVSLPQAVVALLAAVVIALAAGRESRTYFFPHENASAARSFHRQEILDSQTCSSTTWIQVDSEKEGVTEDSKHDGVEQEQNHNQSAHQLLVDLKDVEKTRIGSEEKLSEFLITFAGAFDLSVTNYHCHTDSNLRYLSCLGALEDGHVGIHSWPSSGQVSFDIFASGNAINAEEIEDVKALLADLFYDPNGSGMALNLKWSLTTRGGGGSDKWEVVPSDLELELQSSTTDMTHVSTSARDFSFGDGLLSSDERVAFILTTPPFIAHRK
jgi:S-adenosylmethionine/arginine decarboxylase-like enzyme